MTTATDELEMMMELEAVKNRYAAFFDEGEVEVTPGIGSRVTGGQTSEAWVTIYSTKDGTASTVTTDAAKRKILLKADGKNVFSLKPDPRYQYVRDTVTGFPVKVSPNRYQCRLHPEHGDREWLDSIGLAGQECRVDTIPSLFQLDLHMKVKHRQEHETILREQNASKENEAIDVQRATLEAMRTMAGGRTEPQTAIHACPVGTCMRFFDSAQGLTLHQNKEHRE